MSPTLSHDLLDELRERWAAAGSPVGGRIRPGSPPELILETLATVGITAVPDEVVTWWTWQNGAEPAIGRGVALGPGLFFLSLEDAVSDHRCMTGIAALSGPQDWDEPPSFLWEPSWFPILRGWAGLKAADCRPDSPERAPVYSIEWVRMRPEEWQTERIGSLGAMVELWINAIDTGLWTYDREQNLWNQDWDSMTPAQRRLDLL